MYLSKIILSIIANRIDGLLYVIKTRVFTSTDYELIAETTLLARQLIKVRDMLATRGV